jgi:hypothetical protein
MKNEIGKITASSTFQSGDLKGTDHSEDVGICVKTSKWILKKQNMRAWKGCIQFRTRTSGEIL